jgi:hypothetical protein
MYLRTIPSKTSDAAFITGAVPLACCESVEDDGTVRPATQADIDNCSQDWRQHGFGLWECHDFAGAAQPPKATTEAAR